MLVTARLNQRKEVRRERPRDRRDHRRRREREPIRPPQDRRRGGCERRCSRSRSSTSPALLLLPLVGIVWTALSAGLVQVVRRRSAGADVLHAFQLTAIIAVDHGRRDRRVRRDRGVGPRPSAVPRQRHPERARRPPVRALAGHRRPRLRPAVRSGRLVRAVLLGRGIQIVFALPSMMLVTIFISIPFVIREVQPVLAGDRHRGRGRRADARRLRVAEFRRVTLPNIRWGAALRDRALRRPCDRRDRRRARGERAIQGKTETATLYILRAVERRQTPPGYIVALTLAARLDPAADRHRDVQAPSTRGRRRHDDPHRCRGLTKRFGASPPWTTCRSGPGRRDHRAARAERLGQEHGAPHDRRAGAPDARPDLDGRRGAHRQERAGAPGGIRLPALRAVPSHDGGGQRVVRSAGAQGVEGGQKHG